MTNEVQAEPVAWQERQERSPGVFGDWYERATSWSLTRDMEITSGGIRYQFRPLYNRPAPAVEVQGDPAAWLVKWPDQWDETFLHESTARSRAKGVAGVVIPLYTLSLIHISEPTRPY